MKPCFAFPLLENERITCLFTRTAEPSVTPTSAIPTHKKPQTRTTPKPADLFVDANKKGLPPLPKINPHRSFFPAYRSFHDKKCSFFPIYCLFFP